MEASRETVEERWYHGRLKKSGDGYILETEEKEIQLGEEPGLEQAWYDLRKEPQSIKIYGRLEVRESLTGTETYSMKPEEIGYILDEDFDGRDVLVSDYDLVFLGDSETRYNSQSFQDLRQNVKGWFDDEDEKLESLTDLKLEKDYWPWGR